AERPAVVEDDRLGVTRAPVLVRDRDPVPGCDGVHKDPLRWELACCSAKGHRSRAMPAHTETASSWRRTFEQVPLAIRTSERDGPVDQAPNRSEESPVHRLYTDEPPASAAIAAIRTGDVARLRTLLAENPRIISAFVVDRSTPGRGRTLLHVVTDWPGHHPHGAETVALLVAAGADVNARFVGPVAETPLHWAASNDDVAVLDALLDHGADIDAPGGAIAGGSPLSDAVGFGQWNAARRLVERGATPRLSEAAALGMLEHVKRTVGPDTSADHIRLAFWYACHGGQQPTA